MWQTAQISHTCAALGKCLWAERSPSLSFGFDVDSKGQNGHQEDVNQMAFHSCTQKHFHPMPSQIKRANAIRSPSRKQVIIVLSSINLLLPTVALYMLSMSDYGRHLERVIPTKVFYQLVHLLVINIPFLGVRIYLWANYNYELSLFVVKNLCYIFMLTHSLYPGTTKQYTCLMTSSPLCDLIQIVSELQLQSVYH